MRAGIFQCDGSGLTPTARLNKLAAALAENPVDLMVCPELFLTGYNVPDQIKDLAESLSGPTMTALSRLALQSDTALIVGYAEHEAGEFYNSAACFSNTGELIANHRKLLLPPGFEANCFTAGARQTLFTLNGMRCGLAICYDAEFPETIRSLAEQGAELIIVPTALVKNWHVVARKVMPARAFENGVWLIYANHAGTENGADYLGESCILTPIGADASRAGGSEEVITATLDPKSVHAAQERLPYLLHAKALRQLLE